MSSERDPFGERAARMHTRRARVLGADIQFNTDSRELLALVDEAFADGPRHRINGHVRRLRIDLRLVGEASAAAPVPRMRLRAGAGFLHGALDRDNFATLAPAQGTALVVVSRPMLAHAHLSAMSSSSSRRSRSPRARRAWCRCMPPASRAAARACCCSATAAPASRRSACWRRRMACA
jgi:hypothetical protein